MRLFNSPLQYVATTFLQELEKSIVMDSATGKPYKSTYYKPSSLTCLRYMYFYRTQTPIDEVNKPASSISILHSGEDRHLRIQNAISNMKKNGFDCEWVDVETYIKEHNLTHLEIQGKKQFETTVYNKDLDMLFLCDGLIKFENKYYIVEIKTENSTNFYKRIGVAEEHKHQATCYSLSFLINNVIFIYENRDFCLRKAFLFTVTDTLKDEVKNLIKKCNECVDKKILPEKMPNKNCKYCDYRIKCSQDFSII